MTSVWLSFMSGMWVSAAPAAARYLSGMWVSATPAAARRRGVCMYPRASRRPAHRGYVGIYMALLVAAYVQAACIPPSTVQIGCMP